MRSDQKRSWAMPEMTSLGRLATSAGLGVVAAVLVGVFWRMSDALAIGWDTTALVYCTTTWAVIWPMNSAQTAAKATSEDPNRTISDVLTLSASVASLGSVGLVLFNAHTSDRVTADVLAVVAVASIAISWLTVHTIFGLRYARLYYSDPEGGIDFNQAEPPAYRDFFYLALTLGMTFQVSDTALGTTAIRGTALRHALLSYLFGTVILAAAINLIAGLGSSGLIR
ncbi:MAG TPA: DUF1345 domain-containing protein [Streptosporangiaceae bacterium]|nr:DUF1345 domain-containing protein [Streptosporangiaceae bacterium]